MGTNERERALLDATDVQRGLREVGAELALGRPGAFIGRSADGYCLVVGAVSRGSTEIAGGHLVIVGLNELGLRAMRQRIDSLLGEKTMAPLPEGLVIQ
jgi:hypothetical protein